MCRYSVCFISKTDYIASQLQTDSLLTNFAMSKSRHIIIQNIEKLIRTLYYGHSNSHIVQILGNLKSDKTATYNYYRLGIVFCYIVSNSIRIFHCTQRKKSSAVSPREVWNYWLCTWRKNKLVIAFFVYFFIVQIMDCNHFVLRVDVRNFLVCTYFYSKSIPKALWRLKRKFSFITDYSANIVRQATIRIRNEARSLEKNDLCILIQP